MKIRRIILSAMLCSGLLVGCSGGELKSENENLKTQVASLEKEVTDLKGQLEKSDKSNEQYVKDIAALKEEIQEMETATVVQENDVELTVLEKKNLAEDWDYERYSDRINFVFEVKNNTDKDIKGVQGIVDIQDMFEVSILKMRLDFTGEVIPANGSTKFSNLGMDVNEFMDEHVKLYSTDLEDLIFKYEVTSILYTDGTKKVVEE